MTGHPVTLVTPRVWLQETSLVPSLAVSVFFLGVAFPELGRCCCAFGRARSGHLLLPILNVSSLSVKLNRFRSSHHTEIVGPCDLCAGRNIIIDTSTHSITVTQALRTIAYVQLVKWLKSKAHWVQIAPTSCIISHKSIIQELLHCLGSLTCKMWVIILSASQDCREDQQNLSLSLTHLSLYLHLCLHHHIYIHICKTHRHSQLIVNFM